MKFLSQALSFTFILFILLSTQFSQAQSSATNCGATAGELSGNAVSIAIVNSDTTPLPSYTVQPSGLPTTNFIISNKAIIANDLMGPEIVGTSEDGRVFAADYGLSVGDTFLVTAFSFDIQQVKDMVHAVYNEDYAFNFTCCDAANTIFNNFCSNLSNAGITDSSDIQSIDDFFLLLQAFTGSSTATISVDGFEDQIQALNQTLGSFGACNGGVTTICYAVTSTSRDMYDITGILATDLSIAGLGGFTTIATNGASLPIEATITPANATITDVTWEVNSLGGLASINQNGVLTAIDNGDVEVIATTIDGSNLKDTLVITISNQNNISVQNVIVSPDPGNITVDGGSLQMTAVVTPNNATDTTITWSISNNAFMATIDQNGLLTANGNNDGIVTVRATANDGSTVYGEADITLSNQTAVLLTSLVIDQDTGIVTTAGSTFQYTATLAPANATDTTLTWSILNFNGNASIDVSTGLATGSGNTQDTFQVVANANDISGLADTAVLIVTIPVGLERFTATSQNLNLQLQPNPFKDQLTMNLNTQTTGRFVLSVIDLNGRVIQERHLEFAAGQHQFELNTQSLSQGIYWIRLSNTKETVIQKAIKY
ncbi:MAG: Ig-like domain-containing protein [Saprospiraceae bacterium]|nr:Ig-like domain-containing protein [Saprospiraceae bacterium]